MPLYEYYCPKCNYQIELIHKVSEKKNDTCPSCQKVQLKKKTSLTSFQLKGGGWYKDGYSKQKKVVSDKKTPKKNPPQKKNAPAKA